MSYVFQSATTSSPVTEEDAEIEEQEVNITCFKILIQFTYVFVPGQKLYPLHFYDISNFCKGIFKIELIVTYV